MNKKEFLAALQARLGILHEDEIKDILEEYGGYIDTKIAEGKTEEEAVQDFGNLDDLVDEILDAYKINKSYTKQSTKKTQSGVDEFINTLSDIINQVVEYATTFFTNLIEENSAQKLVRILVLILIAIIMMAVMRIPFYIFQALGSAFLHMLLPYPYDRFLVYVWEILLNIFYLLIGILVIVGFVRGGYDGSSISYQIRSIFQTNSKKRSPASYTTTNDTIIVEADVPHSEETAEDADSLDAEEKATNEEQEDTFTQSQKSNDHRSEKQTRTRKQLASNRSFGKSISYLLISIMKFFAFLLLLPVYGMIAGLAVALGVLIYLFFQGISVFGLFILVIGGLSLISLFVSAVWYLFGSRKHYGYHMKAQLITSCILIGFGGVFTFYDFMKLEYLDTSAVFQEIGKHETLTFDLKDEPITFHVNHYTSLHYNTRSVERGKIQIEVNYFEENSIFSYRDQNQEQYISVERRHNSYSPYHNSIAVWLDGLRNNKVYAIPSNLESYIVIYIHPDDFALFEEPSYGIFKYNPKPVE